MSFLKRTGLAGVGTGIKIGGATWDKLVDYFEDVALAVAARINTITKFRDQKLYMTNPAGTFDYIHKTSAITANRTVTWPLLTGNDTVATLGTLKGTAVLGTWLIFKASTTYYAVNAATNDITYSSTNFLTLLDLVLTAIVSTGGLIQLGPGDFVIPTLLTINQSKVAIRGCGVDVTRIVIDTALTTGTSIRLGTTSMGSAYTVTVNALKHQRVVTVASTTGIAAGDWVFMNCLRLVDATSLTRFDAEMHKVLSVTATEVTLEDNLMEDYLTTDTATFYKVPFVKNISIQDLTIIDNRGDNNVLTAGDGPFHCIFNYGLYLHNVKLENMPHDSIRVEGCFDTLLSDVFMENPVSVLDDPDHEYGLYITGCSTNTAWVGGWGNACRHTVTNNTNSGGVYRRGRQRGISITGVNSFNANVAHFDLHQCGLGATFTGCNAIAGQHSSVSVDVQGFNMRAPATITGCTVNGMTHEAIVVWVDGDVAGSDLTPGGNRTIINACQIIAPLHDDADTVRRGIVVQTNRQQVIISNNQFFDINQESILLEGTINNVIISNNMFVTCGANLSSTNGIIKATGTISDTTITGNIMGAGTPAPAGRPLVVTTAAHRLLFVNNNVNGLTNLRPTLPSASTNVTMKDNPGLSPLGIITNPINTTVNSIGYYGGTTGTPVSATDYKVVGGPIILTISGGTVSDIMVKDPAGTTLSTGSTTFSGRYVENGYFVRITFSVVPTVIVGGI